MWFFENAKFFSRKKETIKKIDPINTCIPWNPVAMKNVDPKQESAIQNGASMYSNAWKEVKIAPSITVKIKDRRDFSRFLFSIS
jgi:hypothetical protein